MLRGVTIYILVYRLRWSDDLIVFRVLAVDIFQNCTLIYSWILCDLHYMHFVGNPASCEFTKQAKSLLKEKHVERSLIV